MALSVTKVPLLVPSMEEVVQVLQSGLEKNFSSVEVSVVDCPDLTQKPFNLSAKGLCGSPRLADVGGPPNLVPLVKKEKLYNMGDVASLVELPGAFMVGAGAGPFAVVGTNSELVCSVQVSEDGKKAVCCNSYISKVDTQDGSCILDPLRDTLDFNLMGNFLCCEGKPGKVLEIKASVRTGEENFMSAVRKSLQNHYQSKSVGLGGVFLIERGKAKIHVMPDFSCTPLDTSEKVNGWLKFYEMDATLVCLGELVSHDPGLDLRVEHFHCFSDHGQGGHYHYDTTPGEVGYRAYFSIAELLYRIDQPPEGN
ncbi:ester hydrolase C11orf54 homolog [Babylonia areolata]|uniref:ester hydrolase C11orf54 homolog n=1 Tax=Babylonia areolata TaxID=304850 RepID=UPI003FD4290C